MFWHRHRWYIDYGQPEWSMLQCAGCGKRRPNVMRWHERCWQFIAMLFPGARRRRKEMIARITLASARMNVHRPEK